MSQFPQFPERVESLSRPSLWLPVIALAAIFVALVAFLGWWGLVVIAVIVAGLLALMFWMARE